MNYQETTINGEVKTWRRAHTLTILNPYNRIPTIKCDEEDLAMLPDGRMMVVNNTVVESAFTDPAKEFPLIHPATGQVIGTAMYQDLYVLLSSLYLHLAGERDYLLANPVIIETPPDEEIPV